MAEPKLTAKKKTARRVDVDAAIASVVEDDMLSGDSTRLPVDVHPILKKRVKQLSDECINPDQNRNSVSMRMLITEFIEDGLKKYAEGNGKYSLEDTPPWLKEYL